MMRTGNRGTEAADSVRIKRPGGALFITTTVPRTSIYRKSYIRVIKRSREKTLTYKKLAEIAVRPKIAVRTWSHHVFRGTIRGTARYELGTETMEGLVSACVPGAQR